MSNTFGRLFQVASFGESHGTAVGCVVDGCPSGLPLSVEDVQKELDRRRPGQSSLTTSRREKDQASILSGIFDGKTLGTPIAMVVENHDADSSKYLKMKDTPRPGHADYTWRMKYGLVDWRGGGRSSARETVGRVAGGAVAKKLLSRFGVHAVAFAREIGGVECDKDFVFKKNIQAVIDSTPSRTLDKESSRMMGEVILEAKGRGDSVGGIIECVAVGVPPGLGEPVFDKLNADLAKAVISIPAVKAIEFGEGFNFPYMLGSEANDEFILKGRNVLTKTNKCGGIQGGISNGMPIVLRVAVKPTSSISKSQNTVNLKSMKKAKIQVEGRHDPCIVPRAVPVVEAMVNLVLADHMLISGVIPRKLD
ncbi:MAG: chorismate synthase [Candidatus Altiarchaeota archaeon]|nr:chorismate synthase [Candidatus Altiarchaeota archaeon]